MQERARILDVCEAKFATFCCSRISQSLTIPFSVPVANINPSGWNWEHVNPSLSSKLFHWEIQIPRVKSLKQQLESFETDTTKSPI